MKCKFCRKERKSHVCKIKKHWKIYDNELGWIDDMGRDEEYIKSIVWCCDNGVKEEAKKYMP